MNQIKYRAAKKSDADQAGELIFDTFPKLATTIFGLGDKEKAIKVLETIFEQEGHRFSYQYAQIAYKNDQDVGLFIAYPGNMLPKLNWHLSKVLLRQFRFLEKFKLLYSALPLIFINEAVSDEFLLSNLAVKEQNRGEGLGTHILSNVEETAKRAGMDKVAFMVTIENDSAQRFYERNNYHVKAEHLISKTRAPQLGQGYLRMVKELPG